MCVCVCVCVCCVMASSLDAYTAAVALSSKSGYLRLKFSSSSETSSRVIISFVFFEMSFSMKMLSCIKYSRIIVLASFMLVSLMLAMLGGDGGGTGGGVACCCCCVGC